MIGAYCLCRGLSDSRREILLCSGLSRAECSGYFLGSNFSVWPSMVSEYICAVPKRVLSTMLTMLLSEKLKPSPHEEHHGVCPQKQAAHPHHGLSAYEYGQEGGGAVAYGQAREYTHKSHIGEIVDSLYPCLVGILHSAPEAGYPAQGPAYEQNQDGSAQDFDHSVFAAGKIVLAQGEESGDTHYEHKEWEYQVGGSEAVPLGMAQRGIDMAPRAGIVDQDHAGYGDASHHIE